MKPNSLDNIRTLIAWYKRDISYHYTLQPQAIHTLELLESAEQLLALMSTHTFDIPTLAMHGVKYLCAKHLFPQHPPHESLKIFITPYEIIKTRTLGLHTIHNIEDYGLSCRIYTLIMQITHNKNSTLHALFPSLPNSALTIAIERINKHKNALLKAIRTYEHRNTLPSFDPTTLSQFDDPTYPESFSEFPYQIGPVRRYSSVESRLSIRSFMTAKSEFTAATSPSPSFETDSHCPSLSPSLPDHSEFFSPLSAPETSRPSATLFSPLSTLTQASAIEHEKDQAHRLLTEIKAHIGSNLKAWEKQVCIGGRRVNNHTVPTTLAKIIKLLDRYEIAPDEATDIAETVATTLSLRGDNLLRSMKTKQLYHTLDQLADIDLESLTSP